MNRDMEIVRQLLFAIEQADEGCWLDELAVPIDHHARNRHAHLMAEGGLLRLRKVGDDARIEVLGLTWQGLDFCDSCRSDAVWHQTRHAIERTIRTASFEVWRKTLDEVAHTKTSASIRGYPRGYGFGQSDCQYNEETRWGHMPSNQPVTTSTLP